MKFTKLTSSASIMLIIVLALASTLPAQMQILTVLHHFTNLPDGGRPLGRLLLDPKGNLYGTTTIGGHIGYGSVFKVDTSGNLSILYSFSGQPDGNLPASGLIRDSLGNLYGTTVYGGTSFGCGTDQPSWVGCGTVFKLDPNGTETVLHRFSSNPAGFDGANPVGPMALDSSGTLWGTTYIYLVKEPRGQCPLQIPPNGRLVHFGCGTVFKVDASGTEGVVHFFTKGDGALPVGGLVLDKDGNLYGTTQYGGLQNCPTVQYGGCGTAFKVDATGQFSTPYMFKGGDGGPDGNIPESSLILDPAGNLYGTTDAGGSAPPCDPSQRPGITCGTIYQLTTSGKETVLHSFAGLPGDTGFPTAGVVRDAAGNFYGLASGSVFKVDSTGKESLLYTFTGYDNYATGDLVQDANGNLYGTTLYGTTGDGTVFRLTTPPDFAVGAFTLSPATVPAGGSASSPLDIITVSGFNDTVSFTCSVSPASAQAPQCSVNATSSTPATVNVTTSGASARVTSRSDAGFSYALWLPLLGLVTIAGRGSKQRKVRARRIKAMWLGCVLALGVVSQVACGGGGGSSGSRGTPAGAYTITVTGTSGAATGSLVRSTSTTLEVQ
ncbi:MAG TPA: choice-of-anchor tandem repeat GloVer-containing protein [Candidatus Dormibacteraeota bacterium]|nr:choice-of-anchor tandem repeat GloVer-containing protein [Candidatus Dormibacteraeota bacterium]